MAPPESMMPPQEPGDEPAQWSPSVWDGPEIELALVERDQFRETIAGIYDETATDQLLDRIGFPRGRRPALATATATWGGIFREFDNGIMDRPWRRLLIAAFRDYQTNRVFRGLFQHHILGTAPAPGGKPAREAEKPEAEQPKAGQPHPDPRPAIVDDLCHVIVYIDTGDDAEQVRGLLDRLGLQPEPVWVTEHGIAFRVNTADPIDLRRALQDADFGYIVVEPGRPDYLYRTIWVNGPDGRRFRVTDAPAQQTVENFAGGVLDQYPPFRDTARPTVVDRVGEAGQGDRLDPDDTLHDAGVEDGDELRVGFQATAGAVHPQHREEALYRVRNQIVAYATSHEGFGVEVDWPQLPSEYTIEFPGRSFAPDPDGGPEPVETDRPHRVLIQFGADFPMTPPHVFWLTPIFHPNVYPLYESEAARSRPHMRGLVCLGELAVSYQPALDFGELCQTLVDIAGFRNYRLFEATGEIDAQGRAVIAGDYFDAAAARWALTHQDRIRAIGGRLVGRGDRGAGGFRNRIEAVDP